MQTKREPQSAPNANQGSMRGIRLLHRPGRPSPFGVQWAEKEWDEVSKDNVRKVKTMFFPTVSARDDKAKDLAKERREHVTTTSIPRGELSDWLAFKQAIGLTPWQDVVSGWRTRQIETGTAICTLTVEDAAKTYIAYAESALEKGKLSKDYVRHLKTKIGKLFVDQFGSLTLDKVSTSDVVSWIDDFDEVQSDFTFDCYKKHVRSFFSYFIKSENPVLRDNPASRIKNRSDGIGEVQVITVAQTAQLFWTALNYVDENGVKKFLPAIGRLSMEAFIGIRFASGCRLAKEDINRVDKGVTLPKKKLKTKRRHYIDGLPENVWAWYDITPDECWTLTPRQYLELKSELFRVARVPHPHNCLRHNFATYHVAAYKDAGKTAYILCHRSQDELYEHYKGIATEANGKLYQTLTPQTVARLRKDPKATPTPEKVAVAK